MTAESETPELVVENGTARLAVRDRGGTGPPVLLVHGFTGTSYDFVSLGPRLAAHHRVVELELRGHGRSTGDSWTWRDAISDVEATVAHLQLVDAAVVGFSFGGMVAASYAAAHPETPAVVNIDGYGLAGVDRYAPTGGATADRLEELRAFRRSRVGRTLTEEEVGARLDRSAEAAAAAGRSPRDARDGALRRLRRLPDGAWVRLPPPAVGLAMVEATETLDVLSLYPRIESPLLTVLALRPDAAPRLDLSWVPELSAAYIEGLRAELARLAAARPNLELLEVDATHVDLVHRRDVAASIADFIARHAFEA